MPHLLRCACTVTVLHAEICTALARRMPSSHQPSFLYIAGTRVFDHGIIYMRQRFRELDYTFLIQLR